MPVRINVIIEWDHVRTDAVQEPGLVDGDVNSMVPGFEEEIGLFRRLYMDRQENGSATGRTDAEVAPASVDVLDHFGNNSYPASAGGVIRIGEHGAVDP